MGGSSARLLSGGTSLHGKVGVLGQSAGRWDGLVVYDSVITAITLFFFSTLRVKMTFLQYIHWDTLYSYGQEMKQILQFSKKLRKVLKIRKILTFILSKAEKYNYWCYIQAEQNKDKSREAE